MVGIQTITLKQYSDQSLVQLFINGEERVLTELVYRYQSKIFSGIYLLVKDRYIAEDLFQETFIKIVSTLRSGKYTDQGKFLPWAMRIAHNLCIDYFRKAKKNVKITLQDGSDILSLFAYSTENIEQTTIRNQEETTVQKLVDQLPLEQKEVIIMRIYGEMSFKEIAEVTGVSINTALGRMRYGLINIKRCIEECKLTIR